MTSPSALASLLAILGFASVASAQQAAKPAVFPAHGQSPQQQASDEARCHDWAVLQVGFDPTKVPPPAPPAAQPPPQAAQAASPAPGSGAKGAARGAARSAVIAGASGGDAGGAALTGAAVGAIRGRRQSKAQQEGQAKAEASAAAQADAAAQEQYQTALAEYEGLRADYSRARAACLEGRGYVIK